MQVPQSWFTESMRTQCVAVVLGASFMFSAFTPAIIAADRLTAAEETRLKLVFLAKAMRLGATGKMTLSKMQNADVDVRSDGTQLSWRVHLLPVIGENELYEKFRFNEPWDSDHNRTLLGEMPEAYCLGSSQSSKTRFQVFANERGLFGPGKNPRLRDIRDGPANTVLIAVTDSSKAVPWTKADDLWLDDKPARTALGRSSLYTFVMADEKLLTLPSSVVDKELPPLVTHAGRETVDVAGLRAQYGPHPDAGEGVKTLDPLYEQTRRIALAIARYADTHRSFPVARNPEYVDEDGSPKLSWRVHLLPFLGHATLYERFNLNESWNSPTNRPLLKEMPDVFRTDSRMSTATRFRIASGPETAFPQSGGMAREFRHIRDGRSNTILVLESSDPTVWTRPEGLPFDATKGGLLAGRPSKPFYSVLADGSVMKLPGNLSAATLAELLTISGREPIDSGTLRRALAIENGDELPNSDHSGNSGSDSLLEPVLSKLRSLAVGMHKYHDIYRTFPPPSDASALDEQQRPNLSWRVHLLPLIGQEPLYQQFKIDEPWDSDHNLPLLDRMPEIFRSDPDQADSKTTRIVTLTGTEAPFQITSSGPNLRQITDGSSNTILMVEVGADRAVPWTKPVDAEFDPLVPMECLGAAQQTGFHCVTFDGAVLRIEAGLPPGMFASMVTPRGGEKVNAEERKYFLGR